MLPSVGAAALAFLATSSIYLGFFRGKGVPRVRARCSSGALAAALTIVILGRHSAPWAVSVASIGCVVVLILGGCSDAGPFSPAALPVKLFLLAARRWCGEHRSNMEALIAGTEDRPRRRAGREFDCGPVHLVVRAACVRRGAVLQLPDRTAIFASQRWWNAPSTHANESLLPSDAKMTGSSVSGGARGEQRGAGVPRYFATHAICGGLALITAVAWRSRLRVKVIAAGLLCVAAGGRCRGKSPNCEWRASI